MSAVPQESDLVINSHLLYKVSYLKVGQRYKRFFFSLRQASTRGGPRMEYNDNLVISLDQVLAVQPRAARSEPKKFGFQVLCNPQVHHFVCETEEDRKRWVNAIRNLVFAQPGRVYPDSGTFEVEVDNTTSSRKLKLFGLYLMEVTDKYIILWLPRSKQEMVRWRLVNIHNVDQRRPKGASMDRLTIELSQFSVTGAGTLMFKVEDGECIFDKIQECAGRRFEGFGNKLLRGKSLRNHSTSQEDLVKNLRGAPGQTESNPSVIGSRSSADSICNSLDLSVKGRSYSSGNMNLVEGAPRSPLVIKKRSDAPALPPTRRRPFCSASDEVPTPRFTRVGARHARTCLSLPPNAHPNPDIMVTAPLNQQQEGSPISPINSDSESADSGPNSPDLGQRPVSPLFPPQAPPTPPSPRLHLQPRSTPEPSDIPVFMPIAPKRAFGEVLPPEPPPRPPKTLKSPFSNGPPSPGLSNRNPNDRPYIPPRPVTTLPPIRSSTMPEGSSRPPIPLPRPADTLPSYLRGPETSFSFTDGDSEA